MKGSIFIILTFVLLACSRTETNQFDYVQYSLYDFTKDDLNAKMMLPNASAGIGTSLKPSVSHEIGGFRWKVDVGRNFTLHIEDYGDYSFRFEEFKQKLLKPNRFFEIEIVKETKNLLIYRRKVKGEFASKKNARYFIYSVQRIGSSYYEIMNREQGDSKKVINFMYHSIQSLKSTDVNQ